MFSLRSSLCVVAACALALAFAATATAAPPPGSGDLVFADTMPLVFPTTTVGDSNTSKVTLKNSSGIDSVELTGVSITGPDADQFSVNQSCPSPIGSSASCDLDVGFNPTRAGTLQATLVVDNNGITPQITRDLSGEAVAANVGLSSNAIDFGIVDVRDGNRSNWVQIQNNGAASVHIDQIDVDGPGSNAYWIEGSNCGGQTLPSNSNCSFYVHFQPQDDETYDATLHVRVPGTNFTASLTGVGGVSDATLAPAVVEFGDVDVGGSSTAKVTMTSSGNLPYVPFVTLFNGGDVGAFRVIKDGCSLQMLNPGDECTLTVRFAPYEAGAVEATLAVLGDGNPKVVTARGAGIGSGTSSAGSGGGGAGDRTASASGATTLDGPPAAHISFIAGPRGIARYNAGWAYLGRARCDGAPRCRVTVRTQFVVTFGDAGRPYLVRGRGHTWTVGSGRRLWAPLPHNLQGTPARVLVTIETRAAGYSTGVQYRNLRLVPAGR
jgi:hypothetical protein